MLLLLTAALAALPDDLLALVSTGDCPSVLAHLDTPATPDERLALLYCEVRVGRSPTGDLSELRGVHLDYARLLRARAAASAEAWEDTLRWIDGLALPGPASQELALLRGRALVGLERSSQAREGLRTLLSGPHADEARFYLAVGGEQRGETGAAIATYERTWASSWQGPWAERAAQRLSALGHPLPNTSTDRGRGLLRDRIALLDRNHQYEEALQLRLLLTPTPLQEARARYRARDYTGADTLYRQILGEAAVAAGDAEDLFRYALGSIRSRGDYTAADTIYDRLQQLHPQHPKAELAQFKRGYSAYDEGNCERATVLFEDFLAQRPSANQADEALWFIGRCKQLADEPDAARAAWKRLIAQAPRSSLVPGATYWLAKTAPQESQRQALQQIVNRWPTNGYAWFAAESLELSFPRSPRATAPPWPEPLRADPRVQRVEILLGVGLQEWARAELSNVVAALPSDKKSRIAAAWAMLRAGDYSGAQRIVQPWCAPPAQRSDPVVQQVCYPRPEHLVVERVAEQYSVPALVPYGIMTAESALQPGVTSMAGARGLMQLMPAEAERIHALVYADDSYDPDRLYSAAYNASLGTAELGLKQHELGEILADNSLPAVIASYNGGAEAVRRWRAGFDAAPSSDEFSEAIGYTETRHYVKRVLGYVMAYRWVYGDEP